MSQLSKTPLDEGILTELHEQLTYVLSQLNEHEQINSFLSEFLTRTERLMFAKRLAIAVLLKHGYSYRDIRRVIRVSFPTIRSVQFWLEHSGAGYQKAISNLSQRQQYKFFLSRVDKILDKNNR